MHELRQAVPPARQQSRDNDNDGGDGDVLIPAGLAHGLDQRGRGDAGAGLLDDPLAQFGRDGLLCGGHGVRLKTKRSGAEASGAKA